MHSHASIVPLIGGETIAMQNVFGSRPEYILSYSGFEANDSQLLHYYSSAGTPVPYILLDQNNHSPSRVDVVSTVCPCAGLSSLSPTSSSSSSTNDWMVKSAKYVLETIQPKVFWGENAPRLSSKMGEPIVAKLRTLAKENGYTFSIYKTKSILHGLSQIRDRTFYFFWKGDKIPIFEYYHRPYTKIEDQIRFSSTNEYDIMYDTLTNKQKPTDNPFYRFVLEEMEGGISHTEFFQKLEKTTNPLHYIEDNGIKYKEVSLWMKDKGYAPLVEKCMRMHEKLESGGNLMRKMTEIGKDHIGAFVGHFVNSLCHPDVDRYINIREALDIMKMPKDFVLQGGVKNLNMICQNVPVTTAEDMATNVLNFLEEKSECVVSQYAIQNNKTQELWHERPLSTLENFL